MIVNYTRNENLKSVKSDWQGTPVDEDGRFVNHEFPYLPKYSKILRWMLSSNPQKEEKLNDTERLEIKDPTEFLASEKDGILWLGHASFFIRLGGKSILLDPVFGEPALLKPLVTMPSPIEKIKRVDYVCSLTITAITRTKIRFAPSPKNFRTPNFTAVCGWRSF